MIFLKNIYWLCNIFMQCKFKVRLKTLDVFIKIMTIVLTPKIIWTVGPNSFLMCRNYKVSASASHHVKAAVCGTHISKTAVRRTHISLCGTYNLSKNFMSVFRRLWANITRTSKPVLLRFYFAYESKRKCI